MVKKLKKTTRIEDRVHAVGKFPGHLKKARRIWNNLHNIKPEEQMSASLSREMQSPSPMDRNEVEKAERAGLTVKNGFVVKEK